MEQTEVVAVYFLSKESRVGPVTDGGSFRMFRQHTSDREGAGFFLLRICKHRLYSNCYIPKSNSK